jgi:hypothetical protein
MRQHFSGRIIRQVLAAVCWGEIAISGNDARSRRETLSGTAVPQQMVWRNISLNEVQ